MGKKRRCTWMSLGERVMGDKFKAGVELGTKRAMTRANLAWTSASGDGRIRCLFFYSF
jgi:hypothetical protein